MKKGFLTLVSGSSGVGKNTIISKLMEDDKDIALLRSCTSRAIRVDDKIQEDGNYAYHFLTKDEFEDKIARDEMLEYDVFSDNYYGISKSGVEEAVGTGKKVIKDITVKGVLSCKEKLDKGVNIVTIFLTLKKSDLKKRLILRQTKDISRRMKHYAFEQKSIPLYDYCIYNDDIGFTIEKIKAIMDYAQHKSTILAGCNLGKYNDKKVQKIVNRLKSNKRVKPIKVAAQNGKIYIVDGINTYLASINTGVSVVKRFVDNVQIAPADEKYWTQLVDQYIQK